MSALAALDRDTGALVWRDVVRVKALPVGEEGLAD